MLIHLTFHALVGVAPVTNVKYEFYTLALVGENTNKSILNFIKMTKKIKFIDSI
ncbi:hypothetical protein [Daejeonella sp. H1SJ63]|uniref:hypothetical protein n=1 Tax=Daejeonella sp. H1SJ63 TaxID=3034145 RepID=UPI0023ECC085|nr:hypothetical protein [Daejeonella sp. H1SJ63]